MYFALHNGTLIPNTDTFREGKRNCTTFLVGTAVYVALMVVLKNLRLRLGRGMDAVLSALFLLWLADCAVMAYTYRSHYGRSIVCELGELGDAAGDDQRAWRYDGATHKYRRPTPAELAEAREAEAEDASRRAAARESGRRGAAVLRRKREIRAARVIQRWWRARLYNPPDGILYLRARDSFYEAASSMAGADPARGLGQPTAAA